MSGLNDVSPQGVKLYIISDAHGVPSMGSATAADTGSDVGATRRSGVQARLVAFWRGT
jgi:hypothetical protein